MKTNVKKVLSVVFVCAMLLGLLSVISFADPYSKSVPLLKVLQDGVTESINNDADANGGVTITQSGWMPWISYYTDEAMSFEANAGEKLYLVYDFTVPAESNVQITLNGWNESVSAAIAGGNAGTAEGGAATILTGTYTGAIEINKSQIGENGRIGIVGSGITIREFKLASGGASTPTTTTTTTKSGETTTTAAAATTTTKSGEQPVAGNTLDLIDNIMNGSDESDETEIRDNGQGFSISQIAAWNVWVLYYNELAPDFVATAGDNLYLSYDFDLTGNGHLCLNGWSNSVAADIAKAAGAPTEKAEDGTPMLTSGTYNGQIKITADTIGENGRLGIAGAGALIRKFQLVRVGDPQPTTTTKAGETTTTPSSVSPTGVKRGDANVDNSIDMKDVLVLRKFIAHMDIAINEAAADVNGDGSVDMKDVLKIRRHIANIEPLDDDPVTTAAPETTTTAAPSTTTTTKATTTKAPVTTTTQPSGSTTTRTPTTQAGTPYINYKTDAKYGSLGVWWWNSATIVNSNDYTKRLDFLQANHVTEIYLCVGNVTVGQITNFIREAATRGMRVGWLAGDASWIRNSGFDDFFARFKNYQNQAPADAKFYGIQLDVEPYIGGGSSWQQPYAELVVRAGKMAHDYGTVIEWDIPFWLEGNQVTINGARSELLDVMAANADALTLMSYRDTAAAVLDISSQETPLSAKYDCRIILGLESNYTAEGPNLSFGEDGKVAMYNVAQTLLSSLSTKGMTGGYGVAIHHTESWMSLKN